MIGEQELLQELQEFQSLFQQAEQVTALFESWGVDPQAINKWSDLIGAIHSELSENQVEANAISFLTGFVSGWRLCLQSND